MHQKVFTYLTHVVLAFAALASLTNTYSQHYQYYFDQFEYNQLEGSLNNLDINFHTSVKGYRESELKEHIVLDSIRDIPNYNTRFARSFVGRRLFKEDLFYVKTKHFQASLNPIFNFQFGRNFGAGENAYVNTRGFSAKGNLGKMFSFYTDFYENQAGFVDYVRAYIDSNHVVPSQGRTKQFKEASYDFAYATGYVNFTPTKYVSFEFGHGKHHIGDGYRSLLLSDNSPNYLYGKISTQVWKIKYVNIWAEFQDNSPSFVLDNINNKKLGTFHYLDFNACKYFSLGFFESIIWSAKDTAGNVRGFDPNYLNPIIFYRPIEYGLGSQDNAFMGFNLKIRPHDDHQIYAQVVLDEFLLSAILGKPEPGWRANKQGFQVGYKYFNVGGVKNLNFQGEFNYVRPYTYSHYKYNSNYAHYNQPLAHPLGANFWEAIGIVRYQNKRIMAEGRFSYAIHGVDTAGVNYGGSPIVLDVGHPSEYNNYVGQGVRTSILYAEIKASYIINPAYGFRVEAGMVVRQQNSEIQNFNTMYVYFGIRTRLQNLYYDY
jgi:hypothetical protein